MHPYRVGIVGATGMVGQRFTLLLEHHPWFQVTCLAASARSAGKPYREAVEGRWAFKDRPIPANVADMTVLDAAQVEEVASRVDFVFCAVDMKKDEIRALEERYARTETPVVSNNSANRGVSDVPMLIPEINGDHAAVIEAQRKRLGTKNGFIAVKPNCSIQSYVPALWPLLDFEPKKVMVCTYQAISGAGKTFERWPEMVDNVIPYIGGEDEKSEKEPLKIFGHLENGQIVNASEPAISAQCLRVACSDGHMAAVSVEFGKKPSLETILERWANCHPATEGLGLPGEIPDLLRRPRPAPDPTGSRPLRRHGHFHRPSAGRPRAGLQVRLSEPQHPAGRGGRRRSQRRIPVQAGLYSPQITA